MAGNITYPFIGKKEVIIGTEVFDPDLVADEASTITVTPSTTEVKSQGGTIDVPNGAYDEISASVTLIINDIATLMKIFPDISVAASYGGKDQTIGQVRFGADECKTSTPVPVVIHNACDADSTQDIFIPNAMIQNGGEFKISLGDPFQVEVNITPMPSPDGYVIFGVGDLDHPSHYDPDQQKYVANDES